MSALVPTGAFVLLSLLAGAASAQVYRCADEKTYTDKPCQGATQVDTRANLLDAGPRWQPDAAAQAPARAIILPDAAPPAAKPSGPSAIWQRKDNRDSAHTGRTFR